MTEMQPSTSYLDPEPETESRGQHFRRRLVDLGATPEEIDDMLVDGVTDELHGAHDIALMDELRAIRMARAAEPEIVVDEIDEVLDDDPAEEDDTPDDQQLDAEEIAELEIVMTGSIDNVLAWVDGDVVRARAALEVEQDREGGPRSTLQSRLGLVLAGA